MKSISYILSIILAFYLLISCQEANIERKLDKADTMLDQYPDSALTILKTMDYSSLPDDYTTARYTLLKTLAALKTGSFDLSDSTWKEAVAYFTLQDQQSREKMLAHYAKAAILTVSDKDQEAINEYEKAYLAASGQNSDMYKALICLNQGLIYADAYQGQDELSKMKMGLKILRECNDSSHLVFGLTCAASAYLHNNNDSEAKKCLMEALYFPDIEKDSLTYTTLLTHMGNVCRLSGNQDEAVCWFRKAMMINEASMSTGDCLSYVDALISVGQIGEANGILDRLSCPDNSFDRILWYSVLSKISLPENNHSIYFSYNDSVKKYENEILKEKLKCDLAFSQRDKAEQDIAYKDSIIENKTNRIKYDIFVIVSLCLMFCVVAVIIWKTLIFTIKKYEEYNKKKEAEYFIAIADMKNKATMLKDKIMNLTKENESLMADINKRKKESSDRESSIYELTQQLHANFIKYHADVIEFYKRAPEKNKIRERIINEFKQDILSSYRNPAYLDSLEKQIDFIFLNVLSKLKKDLILRQDEITLLILNFCGFDYLMASEIMQQKASSVSSKITRLKNKIKTLDTPYKELYQQTIPMIKQKNRGMNLLPVSFLIIA